MVDDASSTPQRASHRYPVLNQTVVRTNYGWNGTGAYGTVHIVAGMAGDNEGLTDRWASPTPDWSAFRSAKLGWIRLTFRSGSELLVEFVGSNGGDVLDTFTMTKPIVRGGSIEDELLLNANPQQAPQANRVHPQTGSKGSNSQASHADTHTHTPLHRDGL